MAYTVNRGRLVRTGSPSSPVSAPTTTLQVNSVSTAVGANVDFLSWQKGAAEIREKGIQVESSVVVNFITDTIKLLGAAKDAGLKIPGLGTTVTSLIEAANKLAKITDEIGRGEGAQLNDMLGVISEGLAAASSIPGIVLTPVGVGMKIAGIGFSATSLVIPDTVRLFVPGAVVPARYTFAGIDFYKDASGSIISSVATRFDTQTNQTVRDQFGPDGKLVMSVREISVNQFEITTAGGVSSLNVNPLSPANLSQNYGEPIKGSASNPAGTAGKTSDASNFAIDDAILAELEDTFGADPTFDPFAVDYAAVGDENALAMVGVEYTAETDFLTGTSAQVFAQVGDNNVVMLASLDISASDAGNGYFTPAIQTINGLAPVNGDLLNNVIAQDKGVVDDLLSGSTSGNLTHIIEAGDATNPDGTPASLVAATGRADWWNDPKVSLLASDAASLISALRSGQSLPIATAGFNFASHQFNDPVLAEIAGALSAVSGVASLVKALEKGDLGRILIDSGSVARGALSTYSNSLSQQLVNQYGSVTRAGELTLSKTTQQTARARLTTDRRELRSGPLATAPCIGPVSKRAHGFCKRLMARHKSSQALAFSGRLRSKKAASCMTTMGTPCSW